MPESNLDLVRRAVDAINAGQPQDGLANASPDIVFDWSRSISPYQGIYRGLDEVRRFLADFMEAWDEVRWDVQELIDAPPDRVVLVNRLKTRGRGSGIEIDATGAQVWTLSEGRFVRVELHQSREDALRSLHAGTRTPPG